MSGEKLTRRQGEVLRDYVGASSGEVPHSIRSWIDGAPNEHDQGCRISGVWKVVNRLCSMGLLREVGDSPTLQTVEATHKGRVVEAGLGWKWWK